MQPLLSREPIKLQVRMHPRMHLQLKRNAKRNHRSLNSEIIAVLERGMLHEPGWTYFVGSTEPLQRALDDAARTKHNKPLAK